MQNSIHSVKALTAEIEALLSEKNAGYTECQEKKRRANELLTIQWSIGIEVLSDGEWPPLGCCFEHNGKWQG